MFYHSYDFAKAHQQELLSQVNKDGNIVKKKTRRVGVRDRLYLRLGEALISLGERIAQESSSTCTCVEFSQGQP